MSLKAKLGRLGGSPPGGWSGQGASRTEQLGELRARMQQLLSSVREEPAACESTLEPELPFRWFGEDTGSFWHRQEAQAASSHVGRMAVEAAANASSKLLALLALDPSLDGTDPRKVLFVDTETTGLGGSGTIAFLVGLAWFDASGRMILEQLLLPDPRGEQALLEHLRVRIAEASSLVSFNGKAFDLPLLQSRCIMNRLRPFEIPPHLDLLHVTRRLHRARLGRCRLSHVEAEVLGFLREDDIEGSEIAARYGHFLRTRDCGALRGIVDHNAWDVLSMAALVGLYGEPLPALHPDDLVGLARTLKRAGALGAATAAADRAIDEGAGPEALRARGLIFKARGDRARALQDFQTLADSVEDPAARLELAKLYEHFVKRPDKALEMLELGTSEQPAHAEKRRGRLLRKLGKAPPA